MVALAIGEAKKAFLEDRILAISECQGETQQLLVIADAGESVFSPLVGP